jgi:hypothetical protein
VMEELTHQVEPAEAITVVYWTLLVCEHDPPLQGALLASLRQLFVQQMGAQELDARDRAMLDAVLPQLQAGRRAEDGQGDA